MICPLVSELGMHFVRDVEQAVPAAAPRSGFCFEG